jgi:hypothetical protein
MDVCLLNCLSGFDIHGPVSIKCLANRAWSAPGLCFGNVYCDYQLMLAVYSFKKKKEKEITVKLKSSQLAVCILLDAC